MYSSVDEISKMIESGKIDEAKIRILNGIQMNSNMAYFKDLIDYLEKDNINIFSEDDGFNITLDKDEWTSSYFAKIRSKLKFNFSKEKLKHYNDIAIHMENEEENIKLENSYKINEENTQVTSQNSYINKDINTTITSKNENKKQMLEMFKKICIAIACICTIFILVKLLSNIINQFKNGDNL